MMRMGLRAVSGSRKAFVTNDFDLYRKECSEMAVTFVLNQDGVPIQPTFNIRKVRRLLKSGRAVIAGHRPFTIRLLYQTAGSTQPVELTMDTGYENIGLSIKSEKHEYVHEEYRLLPDEKQHHDNQRRQVRQPRRNRKRYRKVRFDNRIHSKKKGWIAPSLANKRDRHIDLVRKYLHVCPVSEIYLEMGQFDTQLLAAVETGGPLPEGTDYQHGAKYLYDTLREAVFGRDGYTCQCCGNGIKDNVILRMHHIGFWKNDRSDRITNLMTVCTKCHTAKNHKPGGKLWNLKPSKGLSGAAFMNTVKWQIYNTVRHLHDNVHITYGSRTKRERLRLNIAKTHANDAYCIGKFRPSHKAMPTVYKKCRRNNRILEKFYDAKYIDVRDGAAKHAAALGCNRTSRSVPRHNENNLRRFRGRKVSNGKRLIRKCRYALRPGDVVLYKKQKHTAIGVHCNGSRVILSNKKSVGIRNVRCLYHTGGWMAVV